MVKILGQEVGEVGYGLMGFTWRPNPTPPEEAFKAMKAALDAGSTFWNGGVFYGPSDGYNSNMLLKKYFQKYPEDTKKILISIKGGRDETGKQNGSEENVRRCIEETNSQLGGTKFLDIYEMARVDQTRPIEEPMRVFKKLIDEGKLGGVTLSEAGPDSIRRASKILPIQGVEVEFSLFETTILSNGVAKACADSDIPVIAYSPLSRGFLTGQIKKREDIPEGDFRRHFPRFSEENFEYNMTLVKQVEELAAKKGCTLAQIAIGWVIAQSGRNGNPQFLALPGATTADRVTENMAPAKLTEEEVSHLDEMVKKLDIRGERYPIEQMAWNFGETPEEK